MLKKKVKGQAENAKEASYLSSALEKSR